MIFYSTKRFKKSLENLNSKKKVYSCINYHLFKELHNKTNNELFDYGFRLNGNHPKARLLKIRIQSCGGNAKSEGFRVIVFVNIEKGTYNFLDVYPKTGPLGKENMKKDERKLCLEELKAEQHSLYTVNLDYDKKRLVIVPKKKK